MIAAQVYPAFSRNFEDDEEYEAARAAVLKRSAAGLKADPILRWTSPDTHSPYKCQILLVALQPAAKFAATHFSTASKTPVGHLDLPVEHNFDAEAVDAPPPPPPLSNGAAASACRFDVFDIGGDALLALSAGAAVPEARAHRWASGLFSYIQAAAVVVVDALVGAAGADALAGGRGSSGSSSIRVVATSAAALGDTGAPDSSLGGGGDSAAGAAALAQKFEELSAPTLLAGAAAALISHAQRRGVPAVALLGALRISEGRTISGVLAETLPALQEFLGSGVQLAPTPSGSSESTLEAEFLRRTENMYM
ncbi:hypothetical protein JKP88DRAFT_237297 [Tribonema minus]|uniref:Proteasome assembly chaperone 1 n=1 Tax=Tribonema minus TaxID=303371 RepID=A0A835Z0K0_9STRA|nr:hypothetical protein JKP88DRAFT_237297 [Tribonema minus]